MTDPLADMFTRIKNGQIAGKKEVAMPSSNLKVAVSKVLKEEGFVEDSVVTQIDGKSELRIYLKYYKGTPVISDIQRVSKPGRRIYKNKDSLPVVLGGLGISIITTSEGVMTDRSARERGHGGEVLCVVS